MKRKLVTILFCVIFSFGVSTLSCFDQTKSGRDANGPATVLPRAEFMSKVCPVSITTGEDRKYSLYDANTTSKVTLESAQSYQVSFLYKEPITAVRVFAVNALRIDVTDNEGTHLGSQIITGSRYWETLTLSQPTDGTQNLTIICTPLTENVCINEIEFWKKEVQPVSNGSFFSRSYSSLYTIESDKKEFSAQPSELSFNETNNELQVSVSLLVSPFMIKRAFLCYKSDAVFRPISIARSINGKMYAGGFKLDKTISNTQSLSEEINPLWLNIGTNTISFKTNKTITLSDISMVVYYDNGLNSIFSMSEDALCDGDLSTGVKYHNPGMIDVTFDRSVSISQVYLYMLQPGTGRASLVVRDKTLLENINCAELNEGWNILPVNSTVADTSAQVIISETNPDSGAILGEVRFGVSPVGTEYTNRMVVGYPTNGEYFGRNAYIQGFTVPVHNSFLIEGKVDERNVNDGSFSISLSKDNTDFDSQSDDEPWNPKASINWSTGKSIFEIPLYLNYNLSQPDTDTDADNNNDDTSSTDNNNSGNNGNSGLVDGLQNDGSYRATLYPDKERVIVFNEVIITIPAGAVDEEKVITITPLSAGELAKLDPGMANVTYPAAGYRFLPHGTFEKDIEIKFQYNKEMLRKGQKDHDVYMYYYDEKSKQWKRLERVAVKTEATTIISKTNHFTDIINATLTVPEHPDPLSYNPNSIKDIKAGTPTAGINLVQPPTANNEGSVNVQYPIELPPGRSGLAPSVAVQYSSLNRNGWVGYGWSIPVQMITVDTKFGVPRYDGTESYVMNGSQLVAIPDKAGYYRERIEGSFLRIRRIGSGPSSYYWEVTDKNGTKYYYGQTNKARLHSYHGSGVIAQWNVEKIVDTNGNTITYSYDIDKPTGSEITDKEPWRQIYLSNINYTGHNGNSGKYWVQFTLDADDKQDQESQCRYGFQVLTRKQLHMIEVRYGSDLASSELIRRYTFTYLKGHFGKTLLQSISQYGCSEMLFHTHSFEYHNKFEDNSTTAGFYKPSDSKWENVEVEDITGSLAPLLHIILFAGRDDPGIAMGGSKGWGAAANLTATFSPFNIFKRFSIGAQGGYSKGGSQTTSQLLDIDGDGLSDQVFLNEGNAYYHKNNGDGAFSSEKIKITGLGNLGEDENYNYNYGAIVNIGTQICLDRSNGESKTKKYFSDINGDGLVDFVKGSQVLYNRLDNGKPVFNSSVPVYDSFVSYDGSDEGGSDPAEKPEDYSDKYYRDDPLRVWKAPFNGLIDISGTVKFINTKNSDDYKTDDGVNVYIYRGDDILWKEKLTVDNITNETAKEHLLHNIWVQEGDKIVFRVNSIFDGAFDVVEWAPKITYTSFDPEKRDENNMTDYVFDSKEDFTIAGRSRIWSIPASGHIKFRSIIKKIKKTSDDIKVELVPVTITKSKNTNGDMTAETEYGDPLETKILPADDADVMYDEEWFNGQTYEVFTDPAPEDDTIDGMLVLRFSSNTAVDWTSITCKNKLWYEDIVDTEASGYKDVPRDDNGNSTMEFTLPQSIELLFRIQPGPSRPWVATKNGRVSFDFGLSLRTGAVFNEEIPVTIAVKRDNSILFQETLSLQTLLTESISLSDEIDVNEGDRLFFVASVKNRKALQNLTVNYPKVEYTDASESHKEELMIYVPRDSNEPFEGGFRNWYYGRWNGEKDFKLSEIWTIEEMADLAEELAEIDPTVDSNNDDVTDAEDKGFEIQEMVKTFTAMEPDDNPVVTGKEFLIDPSHPNDTEESEILKGMWLGHDNDCWISATTMSSTRVIEKYPLVGGNDEESITFVTSTTTANRKGVSRRSKTKFWSLKLRPTNIGYTGALGETSCIRDLFDLNGDGYPDEVKSGKARFTNKSGTLGSWDTMSGLGDIRKNDVKTFNFAYDPSGSQTYISTVTMNGDNSPKGNDKSSPSSASGMSVGGAPGGVSIGVTDTVNDFIDVNGDGLPDRIEVSGDKVYVRLNLGYKLGSRQLFYDNSNGQVLDNSGTFRKEISTSIDVNLGFSVDASSFGGGINGMTSQVATEVMYADVNGDGLPDRIEKSVLADETYLITNRVIGVGDDSMRVWYNLGNGFSGSSVKWSNGHKAPIQLKETLKDTMSVSSSSKFPVLIPIPFGVLWVGTLGTNPGISDSTDTGFTDVTLQDINGDGLPDHVKQTSSDELDVRLNKTGKVNLLTRISRPLGGSIDLDYERKGNTNHMPESRWVLSKVTINDGMGAMDDKTHTYTTTIDYKNGFYHRGERDFLGFDQVIVTDPEGKRVEESYHNTSFYKKGLKKETKVYDTDNNIVTETILSYNENVIIAGASFFFPMESNKTTIYEYVNGTPISKSTEKKYLYDNYGNILEYTDIGDTGTEDNITARLKYDYNEDAYIIGKPYIITVVNNESKIYRKRIAQFDNKGNMRTLTVTSGTNEDAVTNIEYYSNGTIKKIMGPENHTGQRYSISYTYDTETASYITGVEDSFGLSSYARYHYKYGKPLARTDTNKNSFTYTYDTFGRTRYVKAPNDIGSTLATVSFYYDIDIKPARCITRNKIHYNSLGTLDTATFVDGLGRVIQTQKSADINGERALNVSGPVVFDHMGRVVQQGETSFTTNMDFVYQNLAMTNPTTVTYDARGRKKQVTMPDNLKVTYHHAIAAFDSVSRIQSTVTTTGNDGKEKVKRVIKDLRGLTIGVQERLDAKYITTRYQYDVMKQITAVTDHEGNTTTVKYDRLGRRTEIDNPDTGRVVFLYDKAGNLIRKITPNLAAQGKSITYQYTFNRLDRINYPNMNDTYFYYGDPSEANYYNRAGRITKIENGTIEEFFYGRLGEQVMNIRSINVNGTWKSYETRQEFDNLGRMRLMRFPDGDYLMYAYDRGGNLYKAWSYHDGKEDVYIKNILYNQFGQRTKIEYGNGTRSTYTYDDVTHRLDKLYTTDTSGKVVQNIDYTFDSLGNITKRVNDDFVTIDATKPRRSVQHFTYDDLDRLTASNGEYNHETWADIDVFDKRINSYTSSFSYNAIGKMITKMQKNTGLIDDETDPVTISKTTYNFNYEYGTQRPHAVTALRNNTGDLLRTFSYDLNGNMTAMNNLESGLKRALTWDDENRMVKTVDTVNKSDNVTSYQYDANGTRVIKKGESGTTVYVNNNYTVSNDNVISKHIFAGTSRLVTCMVTKEEVDGKEVWKESGRFYTHPDHLGSSSLITNKAGSFHEQLEYFPYGELWVQEKVSSDSYSTPYKFTGKEQDSETGLYYYGARYYDAQLSRWIGADPALEDSKYFPEPQDFDSEHDYDWYYSHSKEEKLPGAGGIFNPVNLDLYHYAGNNPITFTDPDGNSSVYAGAMQLQQLGQGWGQAGAALLLLAGVGFALDEAIDGYNEYQYLQSEVGRESVEKFKLLPSDKAVKEVQKAIQKAKILNEDKTKDNVSGKEKTIGSDVDTGTQDKKLSKGEIDKLKAAGLDPHDVKRDAVGKKGHGKVDLFKDPKGDIKVKPKSGKGPGVDTGLNINEL